MLDDILVLARSGRAREEPRPVDLAALVDAVVEDFRELGRDVTSTAAGAGRCGPADLMRRAVRNLIDNAVKYGGSARVRVAARAARRCGSTSPTTARAFRRTRSRAVFEPFYRLETSRNRETGGIGLGLAIARAIAESHGGRLELAPASRSGLRRHDHPAGWVEPVELQHSTRPCTRLRQSRYGLRGSGSGAAW